MCNTGKQAKPIKAATTSEEGNTMAYHGNRNAERTDAKVNFIWRHYHPVPGAYKTVQTRMGGGTRTDSFLKTDGVDQLLPGVKKLYFPNGLID